MLSADGRQRLDPFLAKHGIIVRRVEGKDSSLSLIFSVSGDKCRARLNCYANTDSQIIPILVLHLHHLLIHQYRNLTDYIITASQPHTHEEYTEL